MIDWLKKHWYLPAAGGFLLISSGSSIKSISSKTDEIKGKPGYQGFSDAAFEAELKKLGWQSGWAWCVMYAKYTWSHWLKGRKKLRAMELINANSHATWKNFETDQSGYFELSKKPKHIGAIAIWQGAANNGTGHAGIVTKIPSDYSYFETIEGNYGNNVHSEIKRTYNYFAANSEGLILKGFINVKGL